MKVQTILGDYLHRTGALKPIKLGEPDRAITVTEEDRKLLFEHLLIQARFNNRMVIAVTVLHFALFILATVLVYYYRESFNIVAAILGGSVLSLLTITKSLIGLWREKWMIDILVNLLPNLTAVQALTFVKNLYHSQQFQMLPTNTQQTPGDN
jgi:hypothetical protein